MFSDLIKVVELIQSAISGVLKFQTEAERKEAALGLLKTYFLLKDCVDEGEQLILSAGENPIERIAALTPDEAIETLTKWDFVIRKQGMRLYELQGYIYGQDHLAVIDPELQEKLDDIIGSKMDRAVSLHGIGAALYFRNIFPVANTNEERARYVAIMAGEEGDLLNMNKVKSEITSLREALNRYRMVVDKLLTSNELITLSKEARKVTLLQEAENEA